MKCLFLPHAQADLRRADLLAKQRAMEDALTALEVMTVMYCSILHDKRAASLSVSLNIMHFLLFIPL